MSFPPPHPPPPDGPGPSRPIVEIAARSLRGLKDPAIAIIARNPHHDLELVLGARFPDSRCRVYDITHGLDEIHLQLAASGRFDLILDVARGNGVLRRFKALFFHTRPGGTLVMRLPNRTTEAGASGSGLLALVDDLIAARAVGEVARPHAGADERTAKQRDFDALAYSLRDLQVVDDSVIAVNGAATLAKIPESETNRFLALIGNRDRVVDVVPAVTWESRCSVRASSGARLESLPRSYDAPELSVREYENVVCLPRRIAFRHNVILPESFPDTALSRLRNSALAEWAPLFVGEPDVDPKALPGSWFYLDNQLRGHFGHALSEQISHLWGWSAAKARNPELKALVFSYRGNEMAGWEYDLLAAGGVSGDDIHMADEPVRVESLVTTSPMFCRPSFVHPKIADTYAQIGAALALKARDRVWPDRIFLSRRFGKRSCHNTAEVEALHARNGFEVIHPEDHPLADQVRLVREASVIAGFAGSGMFQIALAGEPKHVIVIGSDSYPAHNEYMMSSVLGHRLDLVVCKADVPRNDGRFSRASFHSDYTLDWKNEGAFLQSVLADL